ncbi:MAG: hypothetical protein PHS37_08190 [Candidatus Omnitrophica bacterium]|nr:hypothetical protein [Candidatus Omnitrophota bacterium]
MIKRFKIRNIIAIIVLLTGVNYGVGLYLSPALTKLMISQINTYSAAKVLIDRVQVWPLTLHCSLKGLKVFDPDNAEERIIGVAETDCRMSLWALLSKRYVFSSVTMRGIDITLKGEPDGSFNLQKITKTQKGAGPTPGLETLFKKTEGKKDWFSRIYDYLKKRSAAAKAKAAEKKEKTEKSVTAIPKGRRVIFKTPRDRYLFEIKNLVLDNAHVNIILAGKKELDIENARLRMRGVAFDPQNGFKYTAVNIASALKKDGASVGTFELLYSDELSGGKQRGEFNVNCRDVDLNAVRFIYEDSLPVVINRGIISLETATTLIDDGIDSRNTLNFKDAEFAPKPGETAALGIIPLATVCDLLNELNPIVLDFAVTGTLDHPEFNSFQDSLTKLLKPYLSNITRRAAEQGIKAINKFLGGSKDTAAQPASDNSQNADVGKTIDSIKALFEKTKTGGNQ